MNRKLFLNNRTNIHSKEMLMPELNRDLSKEQERLIEAGRQDTTTLVNISVTVYTTVQYRYMVIMSKRSKIIYFLLSLVRHLPSKF